MSDILRTIELDEDSYIELLTKLIGESEFLQNNPPDLIPEESRACKHVLDVLEPFSVENGGVLEVKKVEFTEGRGNILIKYPGESDENSIAFVGSHMDVVPANPETWERNPFELVREEDRLYGRGTTDCLGHVAVLTCLFAKLAELKPKLKISIYAVFIASEEAEGPGVGIDGLLEAGHLDVLKTASPVLWIDCADSQPCIGTGGAIPWHLKAKGKLFHSGLPHKAINSIEFANEALKVIQKRFYEDFPAHPKEELYNFQTPSTMKPTQISCPKGGLNQIPPSCTISGDIRLTPFYDIDTVKNTIDGYVKDILENLDDLDQRGPVSKYILPEENLKGELAIEWGQHCLPGVACSLESAGYKSLCEAVEEITGKAEPYSICGSLPLVGDLQKEGFDIQLIGFGLSATYHADNEYCNLGDMKIATKVLSLLASKINDNFS
eukprot:TRINITY_DN143_c0_g4_i1.p1 TRINITY_DN143_c0_g4~~TRINITY_DN143_c0_g4_i1.p1  ORF type:complete len:447 (-),score=183.82 TRINITY_DN143_c0_g4_i1:162-1475(-)